MKGTLVKSNSISKLATITSYLKLRNVISFAKDEEFSIIYWLIAKGEMMGTINFTVLKFKVPIEEMIGLSGTFGLCTLGRPYRNPGREPEVDKKLQMFSL